MKDANTVYENIQFTPNGEIDRMFPVLLSDNAKLQTMLPGRMPTSETSRESKSSVFEMYEQGLPVEEKDLVN